MNARGTHLLFALTVAAGALSGCGGGVALDADAGDAAWECTPFSLCDDGDRCTTMGVCSEDGVCQPGEPLVCEPSDACHEASCDPARGCVETLIDEDGDGFASTELGFCGLDCDDTNPARYPGAEEICDGIDNNCDPSDDEEAVVWYEDCDGYDHGVRSESSQIRCDGVPPAEEELTCQDEDGGWAVARDADDCCDDDARYFPGSTAWIGDANPSCGHHDANCDGEVTLRWERANIGENAFCGIRVEPLHPCTGPEGWHDPEPPGCGENGTFTHCVLGSIFGGGGCERRTESRRQECQ